MRSERAGEVNPNGGSNLERSHPYGTIQASSLGRRWECRPKTAGGGVKPKALIPCPWPKAAPHTRPYVLDRRYRRTFCEYGRSSAGLARRDAWGDRDQRLENSLGEGARGCAERCVDSRRDLPQLAGERLGCP